MIEAYVDPFEPPMTPKVEMEFVKGVAESFAKEQPCAKRIDLTLLRDQYIMFKIYTFIFC